jgi:hypothetical protein
VNQNRLVEQIPHPMQSKPPASDKSLCNSGIFSSGHRSPGLRSFLTKTTPTAGLNRLWRTQLFGVLTARRHTLSPSFIECRTLRRVSRFECAGWRPNSSLHDCSAVVPAAVRHPRPPYKCARERTRLLSLGVPSAPAVSGHRQAAYRCPRISARTRRIVSK